MFYSILFPTREQHERQRIKSEPGYFKDLNLDQVFAPVLTEDRGFGVQENTNSGLDSFFYTPLQDREIIKYRQDVLRELENDALRSMITNFVHKVAAIEGIITEVHDGLHSPLKWRDNFLIRGQLLEFIEKYSRVISDFADELLGLNLRSDGLRSFAEYLKASLASKEFSEMREQAKKLREKLSTVEYCMNIKFPSLRIRKYEGQADLGRDLLDVFSKFKSEDTQRHLQGNPEELQDSRMEATVLNMIAVVYKDIFSELCRFFDQYNNFENETILRFSHEIQFYLIWLSIIEPIRRNGLQFCYPEICDSASRLYSRDGFDIALAYSKRFKDYTIVTNGFELDAPEKIIVITGPNQGGKTTFARAFGQMHHLASLGLCVPGRGAALFLFDTILTHFEREEDITTQNGKLQDDLLRLRDLMDKATPRSIVIINEIFGSTTFQDALSLGMRLMSTLAGFEAPSLLVTFIDELAGYGPETISMMSTVREDNPIERTFKIVRKPPDGLAFAMYLARKHGLAYEQASGRLAK